MSDLPEERNVGEWMDIWQEMRKKAQVDVKHIKRDLKSVSTSAVGAPVQVTGLSGQLEVPIQAEKVLTSKKKLDDINIYRNKAIDSALEFLQHSIDKDLTSLKKSSTNEAAEKKRKFYLDMMQVSERDSSSSNKLMKTSQNQN